MNKYPVFCGFYIDVGVGDYVRLGKGFEKRCEELDIPHDISTPQSLIDFMDVRKKSVNERNWICRFKPFFLLEMLDKWDRSVLYTDTDNHINRKPPANIFDIEHVGIDRQYGGRGGTAYCNASATTIYFNNTDLVRKFLTLWAKKCKTGSLNKSDHLYFKKTIVAFRLMGQDAVQYFSHPFVSLRDEDDPYIRHYQLCDQQNILNNK